MATKKKLQKNLGDTDNAASPPTKLATDAAQQLRRHACIQIGSGLAAVTICGPVVAQPSLAGTAQEPEEPTAPLSEVDDLADADEEVPADGVNVGTAPEAKVPPAKPLAGSDDEPQRSRRSGRRVARARREE